MDWDRCSMFAANWTEVLANMTPPAADTPTVPCRNGWEFLYHDIPYTTVVSEVRIASYVLSKEVSRQSSMDY